MLLLTAFAESFRHDWRMSLAFEQELDGTLPDLLDRSGRATRILARVNQRMLASATPRNELTEMVQEAREILRVESSVPTQQWLTMSATEKSRD